MPENMAADSVFFLKVFGCINYVLGMEKYARKDGSRLKVFISCLTSK
jgi:hypothetical protein